MKSVENDCAEGIRCVEKTLDSALGGGLEY